MIIRDKTTFSNYKNMTTVGKLREYDGPAREKEREPVNANDMNENFCVFADSMEKLDHHPVAQKVYIIWYNMILSPLTYFCNDFPSFWKNSPEKRPNDI